ncbi:hypothetical protein [Rhodococcus pyridinivorans]|uniref:hypothetical protein n=1 Tax=Rhodococcus pyridinivorans TaxID=103816 RepID=UPI0039B5D09A
MSTAPVATVDPLADPKAVLNNYLEHVVGLSAPLDYMAQPIRWSNSTTTSQLTFVSLKLGAQSLWDRKPLYRHGYPSISRSIGKAVEV